MTTEHKCRCHDPAVFGHTELNCGRAMVQGYDLDWRRLPRLTDPTPRADPEGMTWTGTAWVRTKDLLAR